MNQPFLSIIIPVHNEEPRLANTLQKVTAFLHEQPYTSEILIVENGSHDQTLQVGLEYAKQFSTLRIIHMEEKGKGLVIQNEIFHKSGGYRSIADADFSMLI